MRMSLFISVIKSEFIKHVFVTAVFWSVFFVELSGQRDLVSGLYFSSHEVVMDERTSLNLTPEDPFLFRDGFSLEFDANFRRDDGYYGYVFRIIGDGETNIDLVANLASTVSNFWLVVGDKVLVSYSWSDIPNGTYDQWLNIKAKIDTKNSKLQISFNGMRREVDVEEIGGIKAFDVIFGANRTNTFFATDVCPMSLKDIRVFDSKGGLFRHWKLSKHGRGNYIYDELKNSKAYVSNSKWFIDRHIKWRKRKGINVDPLFGVSHDPDDGRVFFVDKDNLYILNTKSWVVDTISFTKGLPYQRLLEKPLIYNKYTNELWSYNLGSPEINKFDFSTGEWSADQPPKSQQFYSHHNRFISPQDSSLVTIFGYGYYSYKADVNHFDPNLDVVEKIDRSDQVEPRYLSSVGFVNDETVFVFGGYGSKSGRQELSPRFFYDLFAFDLNEFSFEKLWTLETPEIPFVPGENLIYDNESNCFYTLVFNKLNFEANLKLARLDVEKPQLHLYGESIPYKFLDTKSWVNLFLNRNTSELVAVTSYESNISVFTMAYPPLENHEVFQDFEEEDHFGKYWVYILILILIAGSVGFLVIRLKKRKNQLNHLSKKKKVETYSQPLNIERTERIKKSSILLIDGFQIFDSGGNDITPEFSPKMKELLLFVILNTIKNGRGVASAKIDENLWGDKSDKSAKNNRNVNISKLRQSLDKIGDTKVLCENSMWKIDVSDFVYCDYLEVLKIIDNGNDAGEEQLKKLIELLRGGEFLANLNASWTDQFKADFADKVIDYIISLENSAIFQNNISIQLGLIDCLFVYAPLNEFALKEKCRILNDLGKRSSAKNIYDIFCSLYEEVLGEKFSISFKELLKDDD